MSKAFYVFLCCALFSTVFADSALNPDFSDTNSPFSQEVEGEMVIDRDHITCKCSMLGSPYRGYAGRSN